MKPWKKITFGAIALFICVFAVYFFWPEKYPGYSKINQGLWKKLHSFGENTATIRHSDILEIEHLTLTEAGDTIAFGEKLVRVEKVLLPCDENTNDPCSFYNDFMSLHESDSVSYWLEVSSNYFPLFNNLFNLDSLQNVYMQVNVLITGTYSQDEYLDHLIEQCQSGRMDEVEAISKSTLATNNQQGLFEQYGKVLLNRMLTTPGDSVEVGDNIFITYTTHLLNGTQVDSTTEMQFEFGKPGQLVGGLQFGLTKMCEGQRARIYMPSSLAFGEQGSSTGIIPPRTPVYFDVHVVDVKRTE
ncbi:MAG: FKBP-type peptidyl-prolyl cis-trans isomerase [Flavobacteriales bacterium]|nr:FKBP-type peptidyl-prolyl cis-trans isomerase [Flavobacteriales bacterium]